ncbi:hypothetical protein COCC4DRAFT_204291 [Bipolaris maydis ATCC 48331]|uniref:Ubiquitin 3 binding protein But2 C-terminal domain-containing protein n=1 Tax=Cochliobolus heterostrophus (strain C4 / ATCC 48331 / race T) TaxID=665024 RepID=N4X8C9_COCH4|nr:uncharacterized protein COCC4DRAFT_204291 [Bipolaris maydis ATCC 48331]ENI01447.1 hypothetical protein COCC4DRAFT_204291 [Bipolaris maydis ATCC 48331]KAJ6201350.1 hypothetical protein J3E72DRAFT_232868 [Bipolaris maydis]
MFNKFIVCSFAYASLAVGASIPQHEVQQPLLPDHQAGALKSNNIHVMLAFIESGGNMQKLAEIPLNTRIVAAAVNPPQEPLTLRLGLNIPSRLSAIKIAMAVTVEDRSISLERLDKIMCRITPKTDAKQKEAMKGKGEPDELSWFMLRDGTVELEDSSSEWFLGGRAIQSFECR